MIVFAELPWFSQSSHCWDFNSENLIVCFPRLGRLDGARRHFKISGEQADLSDLQRMEKIGKHVAKCFEARKVTDWQTVVRESDAAVVAGADSAPQVWPLPHCQSSESSHF